MQTYAHVFAEVQRQVATKMDEILGRKPGCYQTRFNPVLSSDRSRNDLSRAGVMISK
jgi:hypothetical protein